MGRPINGTALGYLEGSTHDHPFAIGDPWSAATASNLCQYHRGCLHGRDAETEGRGRVCRVPPTAAGRARRSWSPGRCLGSTWPVGNHRVAVIRRGGPRGGRGSGQALRAQPRGSTRPGPQPRAVPIAQKPRLPVLGGLRAQSGGWSALLSPARCNRPVPQTGVPCGTPAWIDLEASALSIVVR